MSYSQNCVSLIGTVGGVPEIKTFGNGGKLAEFSVATEESWKDKKSGEKKTLTTWHNIKVQPDGLCGVVEKFVTKGSRVAIKGQLRTESWTKDGMKFYKTVILVASNCHEIGLLDTKARGEALRLKADGGMSGNTDAPQEEHDLDDEIPF